VISEPLAGAPVVAGSEPQVGPTTVTTASGLRVHAIQTGFVAFKAVHRKLAGPAPLRLLSIALDRGWTEWMPIYTWAIKHPEGVIVVDSGESSRVNEPGFVDCDPATGLIYRNNLRFDVEREDEIGPQLTQLGIAPREVRWVVLTHLHSDHADGLYHFRYSQILVSLVDYPKMQGALTCRYPDWLVPTPVRYADGALGSFPRSQALTAAGDVHIVPTPGHSLGHQSLLLDDGEVSYLFAGRHLFLRNPACARHRGWHQRRSGPGARVPGADPRFSRRAADGGPTQPRSAVSDASYDEEGHRGLMPRIALSF
jgi:glyoxylase-like metal-dependent hydrolase (beta-lactamase superfamily II)